MSRPRRVGDAEHEQAAGSQQLEEAGERGLDRWRNVLEHLAAHDQVVAAGVVAGRRHVEARLAVVERVRVAHAAAERRGQRRVIAHPGADEVGPARQRRERHLCAEELAGDDVRQAAEPGRRAAHRAGGGVARPAAILGDALRAAQVAREPVQARVRAGQAQVVEAAQLGRSHPRQVGQLALRLPGAEHGRQVGCRRGQAVGGHEHHVGALLAERVGGRDHLGLGAAVDDERGVVGRPEPRLAKAGATPGVGVAPVQGGGEGAQVDHVARGVERGIAGVIGVPGRRLSPLVRGRRAGEIDSRVARGTFDNV